MVIDTWTKKVAPTPIQLRDSYGPGSFQVQDAQGNQKKWSVAAFNKTEQEAAPVESTQAEESQPPPPFRVAPDPPPAGPLYQHPQANPYQQHAAYHQPQAAGQWGESHRQTYQPPPVAPAAPSTPDPQLLGTFYRLDAAIQQISADCRRLQDELRSVTYELQQVPNRVAERVTSAISDAVDPFDQMSKVWEMSRNIADGYGPGQKEEGGGMSEMIQAAVAALAARAQPQQPMPQAMLQEVPQLAQAAPGATPAPAPPAAQTASAADSQELAGMTPELKAELEIEAAKRGITWQDAINLAKRYNWDAPQLLMAARATGAPQAGPSA